MEPVIKVRYKEKWTILVTLLLVFPMLAQSKIPKCDKTPRDQGSDKSAGASGFSISVSGSPQKYRPGQVYTITLSGVRDDLATKFQGFMLVAEPSFGNTAIQNPTSLGTFQLMAGDAMTKFSHRCSHAIEATSSMNKEAITVYWTSPPKGSGCIDFKAMIVERQDVWFMDEGALTYSMCEDDGPLSEPPVVEPCCACDEAKYEAIFEGIWSRHTHPKDFPNDEWRTMFSTLIGASHSANYTLWEYGREASQPLQILGEVGVTRRLESEMKRYSSYIRSVVKAQGLQQRSNVVGQTFAVFRVDRIHHLLSVVSKMIPSPDWIVGLAKENLCLANCSWVAHRVIDLYPWDLGTDAGLRYDGPPRPQRPKGVVTRITSSNPHSDESPFYDPSGAPMKPAARIHLIKQREYFKNCPEGMVRPGLASTGVLNPSWTPTDLSGFASGGANSYYYGTGIGQAVPEESYDDPYSNQESGFVAPPNYDYNAAMPTGGYEGDLGGSQYDSQDYSPISDDPCVTTDWGDWSECSSTCDSGSQSRMRDYIDRENALMSGCDQQLFEKRICDYLPKCETKSYAGNFLPFEVDQMSGISTPWLERGLKSDSQLGYNYETKKAKNFRQNSNRGQAQGYAAESPYGNSYTYDGSFTAQAAAEELPRSQRLNAPMQGDCDVSPWGDWSDCSSKCDVGSRTRTRVYIQPKHSSDCSQELYEVQPCRGNEADCPPPREPNGTPNYETTNLGFGNYGSTNTRYEQDDPACQTSPWSEWSPCSKKCGTGFQRRTRLYLIPFAPNRSCDVRLYDKQDCQGADASCNNFGYYGDRYNGNSDFDAYEKSTNAVVQDLAQKNTVTSLQEYDDSASPDSPEICSAPVDPGNCRGHSERWYFDEATGSCLTFSYTGCYGNRNNFASRSKCEATCLLANQKFTDMSNGNAYWTSSDNQDSALAPNNNEADSWKNLQALSFIREVVPEAENNFSQPEPIPEPEVVPVEPPRPLTPFGMGEIDCQISAWSTWSDCSTSCGTGWQLRKREVLINPSIGGKACPKKTLRKRKCRKLPCPVDAKYWYQGSWRHMVDPEDA